MRHGIKRGSSRPALLLLSLGRLAAVLQRRDGEQSAPLVCADYAAARRGPRSELNGLWHQGKQPSPDDPAWQVRRRTTTDRCELRAARLVGGLMLASLLRGGRVLLERCSVRCCVFAARSLRGACQQSRRQRRLLNHRPRRLLER